MPRCRLLALLGAVWLLNACAAPTPRQGQIDLPAALSQTGPQPVWIWQYDDQLPAVSRRLVTEWQAIAEVTRDADSCRRQPLPDPLRSPAGLDYPQDLAQQTRSYCAEQQQLRHARRQALQRWRQQLQQTIRNKQREAGQLVRLKTEAQAAGRPEQAAALQARLDRTHHTIARLQRELRSGPPRGLLQPLRRRQAKLERAYREQWQVARQAACDQLLARSQLGKARIASTDTFQILPGTRYLRIRVRQQDHWLTGLEAIADHAGETPLRIDAHQLHTDSLAEQLTRLAGQ